ncbi:MAG: polymer-forming cytoskeletal protein [Myxococcota bacterium]|nr:polymer-forming cytoskeletal protein [Myxococcota bacterium]
MASKDLTPAPGEIAALLGRGTKFCGKLVFEGRVRVDGAFDGEVHTEGVLVVGEQAVLDGTFDVGSLLVLGGTVRGKVRAREVIELHADSHVLAELETPRLFVDKGARFDGSCRMTDGAPSQRLPLDETEGPISSETSSSETSSSETKRAEPSAAQAPSAPAASHEGSAGEAAVEGPTDTDLPQA